MGLRICGGLFTQLQLLFHCHATMLAFLTHHLQLSLSPTFKECPNVQELLSTGSATFQIFAKKLRKCFGHSLNVHTISISRFVTRFNLRHPKVCAVSPRRTTLIHICGTTVSVHICRHLVAMRDFKVSSPNRVSVYLLIYIKRGKISLCLNAS